MILAEIGRAIGADAVFLDADAVDVETADDRPAGGAGREARAGNAGLAEQRSPSVAAPLRRISSFGTTVTVANWSVTIGQHAALGLGDRRLGLRHGQGAGVWPGAVRATRGCGRGVGRVARRMIGLGAVTVISGSCVEVGGEAASCATA